MKKYILPTIIALSALSVSLSAAYYSVSGLSKLFAGSSTEVMIMAGSLEVAKLVIATLLHQYWDKINKALRAYLLVACLTLMGITSIGIYGFLSGAYQETYSEFQIEENQKGFVESKIEFYENDIERIDQNISNISDNIKTLSSAKTQRIQVRDTNTTTGYRSTVSTAEIRQARRQIENENERIKEKEKQRLRLQDSLRKYQNKYLVLDNSSKQSGELGPLQYLSEVTEMEMSKVINILLLIIIFVFDPLAIALVVSANYAFDQIKKKKVVPGKEEKKRQVRGVTEGAVKTNVKKVNTEKTAPPPPPRDRVIKEGQTPEKPKEEKVVNETTRMKEVVDENGVRKWKKKDEDSNKIHYLK